MDSDIFLVPAIEVQPPPGYSANQLKFSLQLLNPIGGTEAYHEIQFT
jgi:hypothetical protein